MTHPPDPELQEAVIRRVRRGKAEDVRRLARFMGLQDTGPIAPIRTSVIITLRLQAWD